MSQPEKYDLVVLGSGEGGKFIAWSLGSQGKRSAVVERRYVGGSYPNIACLPSKNVIQRAKVVSYFHRGGESRRNFSARWFTRRKYQWRRDHNESHSIAQTRRTGAARV
jgi:pyruvate/2-oxoglutarate dehydrogenase complex dihydrolipoamide dehydrogenase (E3) component